jgi:hypothetical protein
MATWDDVDRVVRELPGIEVDGRGQWSAKVRGKLVAWERPLRKGDLEHLGDRAPQGDVLAVKVPDEGVKQALIADDPVVFFTTPHFEGYPAVLAVLAELAEDELRELLTDAWLEVAPKRVVKEWRSAHAG